MPRLLNQAAHQAFLLAFLAGTTEVDAEAALEALAHLGLQVEDEGELTEERNLTQDEPAHVITKDEPDEDREPATHLEAAETSASAADNLPKPGNSRPHRLFAAPRRPA